jgi:hypothetical protein
MLEFDYSVSAELFPFAIASTTTNHFGTGDSRALLTPFALRSKNFRPTFLSAPFLKSTARDTATDRFVACTRAPTILSPAAAAVLGDFERLARK